MGLQVVGFSSGFCKLLKEIILFTTGNIYRAAINHHHIATFSFNIFHNVINVNHVAVMDTNKTIWAQKRFVFFQ